MKLIQHTALSVLVIVFLLSSTGIIIFQSHCLCTDDEQISLYVSPESCEDDFHVKHVHHHDQKVPEQNQSSSPCDAHTNDCGCEAPQAKYLKLENQVYQQNSNSEKIQPVQLKPIQCCGCDELQIAQKDESLSEYYIDLPPKIDKSLEFLISIHQLKIPHTA